MSDSVKVALAEPFRRGESSALLALALAWLENAAVDGREGLLPEQLYPVLFPAVFSDVFEELDEADSSRLELARSHQEMVAVGQRALDGEPLNGDDLLRLASLAGWLRRLSTHVQQLERGREVFTVLHLWAIEQVVATLE